MFQKSGKVKVGNEQIESWRSKWRAEKEHECKRNFRNMKKPVIRCKDIEKEGEVTGLMIRQPSFFAKEGNEQTESKQPMKNK